MDLVRKFSFRFSLTHVFEVMEMIVWSQSYNILYLICQLYIYDKLHDAPCMFHKSLRQQLICFNSFN